MESARGLTCETVARVEKRVNGGAEAPPRVGRGPQGETGLQRRHVEQALTDVLKEGGTDDYCLHTLGRQQPRSPWKVSELSLASCRIICSDKRHHPSSRLTQRCDTFY